uniref:Uncharacterized protein n=1 Tax=Oryza glumipatula TaxID=40148 RepID=A0A0D9ZX35_9ORYZ
MARPTVTHVEFQLWVAAASSSASPPERLCFPKTSSIADWEGRWRRKGPHRYMKTGCVALVLCFNISVDPPDVIKISSFARCHDSAPARDAVARSRARREG